MTKTRKTIGVMVGGITDDFTRFLCKGLREAAKEQDVNMVVLPDGPHPHAFQAYLKSGPGYSGHRPYAGWSFPVLPLTTLPKGISPPWNAPPRA